MGLVTPAPDSSGLAEWTLSEECVPRLDCVSPGRKRDSKPPTGECATSAGGPSEEVANVDAKQEHDMSQLVS